MEMAVIFVSPPSPAMHASLRPSRDRKQRSYLRTLTESLTGLLSAP